MENEEIEMNTENESNSEKKENIILAIESSCDETACAITSGRKVLSNVISSQIEIHRRFGGVVPEIASRNHTMAISNIVKEALDDAKLTLKDIDAIAVTKGSGLLGALIVGVTFAKGLSYATKIPLYAVNHLNGHIAANYIAHEKLKPPYICLLVSGGHTMLLEVIDYNNIKIHGTTRDDACGEAFDKVARVLGLFYPGGPEIERLAKIGKPSYSFTKPFKGETHYDFSFSGIKTAVINLTENEKARGNSVIPENLACSFQECAIESLKDNAFRLCNELSYKKLAVAGGVGANGRLKEVFQKEGKEKKITVYFPPRALCTDNAAMIGVAAHYLIESGEQPVDLTLDADANLRI